jgi:hypothetical protein
MISHLSEEEKLPQDLIRQLADLMPQAVVNAFDMCGQKQVREDVRVDTKPFSPYAKNQPLVSIHITLKEKSNRGESFAEAVSDFVSYDVGVLLQEMCPEFDRNNVHITVDLVTRRFKVPPVIEPQ